MYIPRPTPTNPADLPRFLTEELQKIAQEWSQTVPYLLLQVLQAEPSKRPEGMLVIADGTVWNPGGGAGVYVYLGGAWVKL